MCSQETIADVFRELLEASGIRGERRKRYEERFAKALWLDRAEVVQVMENEGWTGGTTADEDDRGGWCR